MREELPLFPLRAEHQLHKIGEQIQRGEDADETDHVDDDEQRGATPE